MITYDSTDLDNATSESGVVHESVANTDHDDASELKPGYSIASPSPSTSLLLYYPLHENSGTVYDFSGNNTDGSTSGGVTQGVDGILDTTAYSFDGTDDYVTTPQGDVSQSFSELTACAWIKPAVNDSEYNSIIARTDDTFSFDSGAWQFMTSDTGKLFYNMAGGGLLEASTTLNVDQWYHAAWTFDGSTSRLYLDANLDGSSSKSQSPPSMSNGRIVLGRRGNNQRYTGVIADARVYTTALSGTQIQNIYDVVADPSSIQLQAKVI